ncbi:uncharacterized protein ColSpa_06811 [Colletotrichum spaethianum]|uniref:Uncharacterized protein n=1 Tax=Colletotrichum spaethianum TaxID=700344 RepID=A0AA37LIL1_9PEZI|nr:uncharacterized protein ColSpa_06811 [Colletotrichum spaethianum]GKT46630.1 hypothetical protein ColSpa_06811 [Colletotrichum spaethianum]
MFRRKKKPAREPPEVFGYDRDALVLLVKRHYELLVDMGHLRPEALQAPPETGWPDAELNVDALRTLGRSEAVIDLLRHLPYPRAGPPGSDEATQDAMVYYETMVLSYLRNKWQPETASDPNWHKLPFAMLGLAPFDKPVPSHMISLTHEESEVGVIWLIDTERGCIYPQGDDNYLYDDAPAETEGDKPWLNAKALSFQTFFDKMLKEISSLKLVPAPAAGNIGAAICAAKDPDAKAMKQLYREYGWPDAFRKDEFLRAAVPARAAILDEQYDWSDEN